MRPLRHAPAAATVLALGLALAAIVRGTARSAGGMNSHAETLGLEMGGICVAYAALAIAGALLLPGRPGARLGLGRGRLPLGAVGVLVLGMLALSHAAEASLALLGWLDGTAVSGVARLLEGARGWPLAVALLGMALAPGVAEEILCRGLLQRSALPALGARGAVVLSALVFGAMHLEPVHATAAAVLGLYLGFVAHRADSTRPTILCHTANNAAAVLGASGILPWSPPPSVSAPAGIAVAALCLLWVLHRHPLRGDPAPGPGARALQPTSQSVDA